MKEEKAVHYYMQGMSQKDALLKAGYSPSFSNKSSTFFGSDKIRPVIEKKRERIMKKAELNEDWIVEKLMLIAGANPGSLIEVDEEGQRRINWQKFGPDLQFLVQDFEEETYQEGRGPQAKNVKRIKVKNSDRIRAMDMLCKILGLYQEKVSISMEQNLIDSLEAARNRVIKNEK